MRGSGRRVLWKTWADCVLANLDKHGGKLGLDKPILRDPTLFLQ